MSHPAVGAGIRVQIPSEPPRFCVLVGTLVALRVLADFLMCVSLVVYCCFLLGRWGDHKILRGNMGVGGFKLLGEVVAFMLLDRCVLFDPCVAGIPYERGIRRGRSGVLSKCG